MAEIIWKRERDLEKPHCDIFAGGVNCQMSLPQFITAW